MQRLCTKLRSLATVSSTHRLLHPPPQFYHRHLHIASASRKWNLNGSLLNTSSSLSVQLPSVATLSSSRLSLLSHSVRLMGFFCFVLCMIIRLSILFCLTNVPHSIFVIGKELSFEEELAKPMPNLFQHLTSHAVYPSLLANTLEMLVFSCTVTATTYKTDREVELVQVRHVSSRERKKRRKPMTPRTSKVKKIKMKAYSSYKERFRTMNDGTIRRWREGKNHNAHMKSKKSKRRLRQPSTVPAAYAKVMKKLNFSG
ncbi:hypothetical protein DKX38_004337 [Salix brachista]|uniref:50S ribosomal protein L35 n=1 Tax=Salix brachista TaxID=2182728 RepID=A0A5N5NCD1_9ROSI|nr:hypothetical protein DKX38_004337 [Salix brachista]